jgi:hypothetical protein
MEQRLVVGKEPFDRLAHDPRNGNAIAACDVCDLGVLLVVQANR